jgi:hypothetical protein
VDGIAKDVPIQIDDHFISTDFLVLDMGEDEYDPPIILGRPFLNTTKAIIYIGTGEVHFHFPAGKVRHHFNDNYMIDEDPKKNITRRRCRNRHRRIRPLRMDGLTMKEKYQDMKIDIPKKRFPLRRKLYHQQRVHQSLWRTKKRRQYNKLCPRGQPHQ